jgi:hypothetical protein
MTVAGFAATHGRGIRHPAARVVHGLHHGKYEKGVSQNMSVAQIKTLVANTSPTDKAIRKGKWSEILFRALSNRVAKRWRFVSFRGAKGGEWCGVVDIIAIRKDTASPMTRL